MTVSDLRHRRAQRDIFSLPALLCCVLLVSACASLNKPQAIDEIGFQSRAVVQEKDGLTIAAVALGAEEAQAAFGLPLIQRGIQPVWLRVSNARSDPVTFLPLFFDRLYFTPNEAAFINHASLSPETNQKISDLFAERALPMEVQPGETAEGFIFSPPDLGYKVLNLIYASDSSAIHQRFIAPVPGLAQKPINLGDLYAGQKIPDVTTTAELRAAIEAMPCCVTDESGEVEADPLNFVIVASSELGLTALAAGGWDPTETVTTDTALFTAGSFLFGTAYRYSPVSDLYAFGRPQDAAFQIARRDIYERNHLRVWLAPLTYRGTLVWIGAISRDIGVIRSGIGTTHKIDPNVDEERWYLAQSIARAQALRSYGFIGGGPVSTPDRPRSSVEARNIYYSDGQRIVLILSDKHVALNDIELIDWESGP